MNAKNKKKEILFGDDTKISKLFENNFVKCIGHDFLLSPLQCACCPRTLTTEAYSFSYQNKVYAGPEKFAPTYVFHTGPDCFDKIARFGKWIKRPPRINIFKLANQHLSSQNSNANALESENIEGFNRINLEALLAINLIFIIWEKRKPGPLQTCYDQILVNPNEKISNDQILTINKAAKATLNKYNNPSGWKKPPIKAAYNIREAAANIISMANKPDKEAREYNFPKLTVILRELDEEIFI